MTILEEIELLKETIDFLDSLESKYSLEIRSLIKKASTVLSLKEDYINDIQVLSIVHFCNTGKFPYEC